MALDPAQIRDVFLCALEKGDEPARNAYLDDACSGNEELRRQVDILLLAHHQTGKFLEQGALAAGPTLDQPPAERPGAQIGPYKLLQQIGEGGMGTVYMAEQTEPVRRKVALKIVKQGMDSRQIIARFEAERQALSLMDHPNIARVLDAGTTDRGRPYFVMELVKGQTITQYCDEQRLTPRQRLDLFIPVCQAVQHAHQKGIIHRDIKPSNVLVAEYDGRPVAKVIDFGVAKAVSQPLTERTIFTGYGQIVGTLEYMSPEQARVNQLDIDTRSDVYSLGVLMYELLTGTTPFDKRRLRSAAWDEMLRIIREEEPPKPSTRLSESKDSLPSVSASRHTEPAKLTRLVRGELDWIVMKALEKDRNRRYETANGLASDIQRYLADEPVQACPPSAGYRLRKFARRNKSASAVFGVILAVLMALGSGIGWVVRDRASQRLEADRTAAEALARVQRLQEAARWPEALAAVQEVEQALVGGAASEDVCRRVQERLADLTMVAALEEARLQVSGASIANACATDPLGADQEYAKAFREYGLNMDKLTAEEATDRVHGSDIRLHLTEALDDWAILRRRIRGDDDASWKHLLSVAEAADPYPWRNQIRSQWRRRDRDALRKLTASGPSRDLPPQTIQIVARWLRDSGAADEAVALLREGQRRFPADFGLNFELGYCLEAVVRPRQFDEAIGFTRAALALRPRSPFVYLILGMAHWRKKMPDEAIACFRRAIELDPNYAVAHSNLGGALWDKGLLDEALACYKKALAIRPVFDAAHVGLGIVSAAQGRLDEAVAHYKKAIELNPKSLAGHTNLGHALVNKGQIDEAIACFTKAVELDPTETICQMNLGVALRHKRQLDEAVVCLRKAVELDPKSSGSQDNLGQALADKGQWDEAVACFRKALELDPKSASAHNNMGVALTRKGRVDEAIPFYRKAVELDPKNIRGYLVLAETLAEQKKLDEAAAVYRQAFEADTEAHWTGMLGNILHTKLGRTNDALALCRTALERHPNSANVHHDYGSVLETVGKMDEAIVEYRKSIEMDDPKVDPVSFYTFHLTLARALERRGQEVEAIMAYRTMLQRWPESPSSHNDLAWLLATAKDAKLCDPKGAVQLAQRAMELNPHYRSAPHLGVAYYRLGDWKAALAALTNADKDNCVTQFYLAMTCWQLADKEKARQWFATAVAWMEKNRSDEESLRRLRDEAEKLLGTPPGKPR